MGFIITKEVDFAASHQLAHLPEDHKCSNLHGHNYVVTFFLESNRLDSNGFVVDFGAIKQSVKPMLIDHPHGVDHSHLNDSMPEIIASAITLSGLWERFEGTPIEGYLNHLRDITFPSVIDGSIITTAENLAYYFLYLSAPLLEFSVTRVMVKETDGTSAVYYADDDTLKLFRKYRSMMWTK